MTQNHKSKATRRLFRPKNSVLFVRPDYHCSFFYRDHLREMGWKADIYVPREYPDHLLFSNVGILRPPKSPISAEPIDYYVRKLLSTFWYLLNGWRYKYHIYYGMPPEWMSFPSRFNPKGSPNIALALARLWGTRLVFLPTGCREELSKREFTALDNGEVCGNCGYWDRCSDVENENNFDRIRKYFDLVIGAGFTPPTQFVTTPMKWKSIDLEMWKPNLEVPIELKLPKSEKIRILHSFSHNGRDYEGRNIKGSPFVRAAVERLQAEGHNVEFVYLTDTRSADMRFLQAQADIIVEQLRYGWWGSTGVETLALGKPVVCYIRPKWKEYFLTTFPEYSEIPIIEASVENIYSVLLDLVMDSALRHQMGTKARQFARSHFDISSNARRLLETLESLDSQ